MSLDAAPVPVTHLPRLQLCDQNAIPPSWAIGTFGMGHNGDTESPFPLAGHPPPPCRSGSSMAAGSPRHRRCRRGIAIAAAALRVWLRSQRQLEHRGAAPPIAPPSVVSPGCSTVLAAFPQLSVKPFNLTSPPATPLTHRLPGVLTPPAPHLTATASPAISGRCSAGPPPRSRLVPLPVPHAAESNPRTEPIPAKTHPLSTQGCGARVTRTPPVSTARPCCPSAPARPLAWVKHLWKHRPGSRDAGAACTGRLEPTGGCPDGQADPPQAAPCPGTQPQRDPVQGDPAAIALFFRSSVTSLVQGVKREVMGGGGRQQGPVGQGGMYMGRGWRTVQLP